MRFQHPGRRVCIPEKEPAEWSKEDVWEFLAPNDVAGYQGEELAQWVSRWVKVRWGTAGWERLIKLIKEQVNKQGK